MNDFVFDNAFSPWEQALERLKAGDTMDAGRFLTLVRGSSDWSPEEAARELEARGVMLDVSGLPGIQGSPASQERLKLEQELVKNGQWLKKLPQKDTLRWYLEDLEQMKSVEDGADLAQKSCAGDKRSSDALVEGYARTVFECACDYCGYGVLLMDLIQEGSLGLWCAVQQYADGPFRPHALWWIRQAMSRLVTLQAEAAGVGDHLAKRVESYQQAEKTLIPKLGRMSVDAEIAAEMGCSLEEAVSLGKMLREARESAKQSAPVENPEENPEETQSVEHTASYQTRERVNDLMSALTEEETMVLNLRYGLNGKAPMTVPETAEKMSMTEDDVVALEAKALAKMRSAQ